jgi:hypothetical protein
MKNCLKLTIISHHIMLKYVFNIIKYIFQHNYVFVFTFFKLIIIT